MNRSEFKSEIFWTCLCYKFWSGLKVGPFRNPLLDKSARDGIIREIAKLHSATVEGIDHFKHRTYPEEHLIWNTYHAYEHIGNYNSHLLANFWEISETV